MVMNLKLKETPLQFIVLKMIEFLNNQTSYKWKLNLRKQSDPCEEIVTVYYLLH